MIPTSIRSRLAAAVAGLSLVAGVVAAQPAPKHHSKLKGAMVGAVAGHAMGHHAKMGAVTGALVQHHRNAKALKKGS